MIDPVKKLKKDIKKLEEFILERADFYSNPKVKFLTPFYNKCAEMWSNGVDLSNKQLEIIYREYNKIKKERE